MNSTFYQNIKCIVTNEGKALFAQQSSGPKLSKIGAVLFSDRNGIIKNEYLKDQDLKVLERVSFQHMIKYTTIIYPKVSYTMYGNIYTPDNTEEYKNAYKNLNNILPVKIAYGNDEVLNEEGEITFDKYMSYDLIVKPGTFNISTGTTASFDGIILLGLTHKPLKNDYDVNNYLYRKNLLKEQYFSTIAILYFPKDDEKIQVCVDQPSEVTFNVETHIHMQDPILLDGLKYVDSEEVELPKPVRFINGLHIVNNGLHDRG